jgi:hypothetical protein
MIENGKLIKTLTEIVTLFSQGIIQAVAQENHEENRLGHLVPWLRVEDCTFQMQINIYI